jgi:uncharacterized protein (DUF608 family)
MTYVNALTRSAHAMSGLAHGGIGAGALELRQDGVFHVWTAMNNAPLFGGARFPAEAEQEGLFFVVRWREPDNTPRFRVLQIPRGINYSGTDLQPYMFRWIEPVARIDYEARHPFTRLVCSDPAMPFVVEVDVWHPFVPHDVEASSIPGFYVDLRLRSTSATPVDVLVLGCMRHQVACDVVERRYAASVQQDAGQTVMDFTVEGVDPRHDTNGHFALTMLGAPAAISYDVGWSGRHQFWEPLLFADRLKNICTPDRQNSDDKERGIRKATWPCLGALAATHRLAGIGAEARQGFVVSWHFPNAYSDLTKKQKQQGVKPTDRRFEGHAYTARFADARAVASHLTAQRSDLEGRTRAFQRAFYDSSLPPTVLDQINSQLNTFATSCWYTASGDFGVQEGITAEQSWGPLTTTDVAMYGSVAVQALFPQLDRAQWAVHRRLQHASGDIEHGIGRNFGAGDGAAEEVHSRVDLAIQFAVQVLRHALAADDRAYLAEMWPSVQKALAYTAEHRDEDHDGVPEIHGRASSYDNFAMYGVASYIASQWVAGLRYAVAAAERLGDTAARTRWAALAERAAAVYESRLWTGTHYRLHAGEGEHASDDACLSDQLIGQWAVEQAGLPAIADPAHVDAALRHIWRRNFRRSEGGLVNCSWPQCPGLRVVPDDVWFEQGNTFWSGVELGFAALLLHRGLADQAFALIEAVDRRYREAGLYFDHIEWGGHYFRALSAWGILHGAAGLGIASGTWRINPALDAGSLRFCITPPTGYGHLARERRDGVTTWTLAPAVGRFGFTVLDLPADGGTTVTCTGAPAPQVAISQGRLRLTWPQGVSLPAGSTLALAVR